MGLGLKFKLPSEWKLEKLDHNVEYILDYRGKTPKKSEVGIPTLSAKSVKNNFIDYNEVYYISEEEYSTFMRKGFLKLAMFYLLWKHHSV